MSHLDREHIFIAVDPAYRHDHCESCGAFIRPPARTFIMPVEVHVIGDGVLCHGPVCDACCQREAPEVWDVVAAARAGLEKAEEEQP
jgi:hypothetical protein